MPNVCKNCGHDQSYRKLNRDGTAYIVLCSKCARLIRIEVIAMKKAAAANNG